MIVYKGIVEQYQIVSLINYSKIEFCIFQFLDTENKHKNILSYP